jgi:hypothetical protein
VDEVGREYYLASSCPNKVCQSSGLKSSNNDHYFYIISSGCTNKRNWKARYITNVQNQLKNNTDNKTYSAFFYTSTIRSDAYQPTAKRSAMSQKTKIIQKA